MQHNLNFCVLLTSIRTAQSSRLDYVDGVNQAVVIVAHCETRQEPGVTQRCEFLFADSPTTSRLIAYDMGAHEVDVVQSFSEGVFSVSKELLERIISF